MSDAPRTDFFLAKNPSWGKADMLDFTRQLEREIARLIALHELGWAKRDCPVCGASVAGKADAALKESRHV